MQNGASVAVKSEGLKVYRSRIENMSLGGMLCLLPERFNIDKKVEFLINLSASEKNPLFTEALFRAKVVRVEPEEKKGWKHRKTAFKSVNIDSYFASFLQTYLDLEVSRGHAKLI